MKNPLNAVRAAVSIFRLVRDPNRLGEVFSLADSLLPLGSSERNRAIIAEVSEDPQAARAFEERPRLGPLDLARLRELPGGTLGREFAEHMILNNLDPSALPSRESKDDVQYFQAHLYETHDIWHVATGFPTDVAGELGLQAFYYAQVPGGLPSALLAGGFLNTLLFKFEERDVRMRSIVRGWLLGKRAKKLFGLRWNELWATPLLDVRARLGIDLDLVDAELAPRDTTQALAA